MSSNTLIMVNLRNVNIFTLQSEDVDRIKSIMKLKNITWSKLSEMLEGKVSKGTVNGILSKQNTNISKEKLLAICDALGIGIENILQCLVYSNF